MNVNAIRNDFPILKRKINGKPIIYFDSGCMSLKPRCVVEAMNEYYNSYPACGGRSVHKLSTQVTINCEESRDKIRRFINAEDQKTIIFTKNATEGINVIAHGMKLDRGDVVLTTDREHNSNLVCWHLMKKLRGIRHDIVMSNRDNTFNMENFKKKVNRKVKLISFIHTGNFDGYTIPAREIIEYAHDKKIPVLLDCAQSAPHQSIDVKKLDVDYIVFSLHKMCGPTGVGALYGTEDGLKKLQPLIVGGETVSNTTYERTDFLPPPHCFEGGLQNYAGIIGAGAAVDYLSNIGLQNISEYETELNVWLSKRIPQSDKIRSIGPEDPRKRSGIFSFNIDGWDSHDIALILDERANIMIRSGMHCAHSWFNAHRIKGCTRISLYFYNTKGEINEFAECIRDLL